MGTFHQYANQILRNGGAAALGFTPDYTVWDQQRAVETLDLTLVPASGTCSRASAGTP